MKSIYIFLLMSIVLGYLVYGIKVYSMVRHKPLRWWNDRTSFMACKNKIYTNRRLAAHGIPVPPHQIIFSLDTPLTISFPLVVKPIDGMQGIDVYADIQSQDEYIQYTEFLLHKYAPQPVMVEPYIHGDVYRILMVNHSIVDVVKRERPYVIGDGSSTLLELINARNEWMIQQHYFPVESIKLEQNEESPTTVIVPRGKRVYITSTVNFHNGAIPSVISLAKIPLTTQQQMKHVSQIMQIKCAGIDYISTNIYEENNLNAVVLEVNSDPDIWIHIQATTHRNPDIMYNKITRALICL